jgi:hypothetical protein
MIICYPQAKRHQQDELRRAKKSAHVFRQSALFLPADLAVPYPKRPCGGVLLKRPFGLVASIVVAELAVVDVESRRAYAAAASVQTSGSVARAGHSAARFSVSPVGGPLPAKSGMFGTCTNVARKASRMNTCAKRVGGWGVCRERLLREKATSCGETSTNRMSFRRLKESSFSRSKRSQELRGALKGFRRERGAKEVPGG